MCVQRTDAATPATQNTAVTITRTAPSILSDGRRNVFRPSSSRASRGIGRGGRASPGMIITSGRCPAGVRSQPRTTSSRAGRGGGIAGQVFGPWAGDRSRHAQRGIGRLGGLGALPCVYHARRRRGRQRAEVKLVLPGRGQPSRLSGGRTENAPSTGG